MKFIQTSSNTYQRWSFLFCRCMKGYATPKKGFGRWQYEQPYKYSWKNEFKLELIL